MWKANNFFLSCLCRDLSSGRVVGFMTAVSGRDGRLRLQVLFCIRGIAHVCHWFEKERFSPVSVTYDKTNQSHEQCTNKMRSNPVVSSRESYTKLRTNVAEVSHSHRIVCTQHCLVDDCRSRTSLLHPSRVTFDEPELIPSFQATPKRLDITFLAKNYVSPLDC